MRHDALMDRVAQIVRKHGPMPIQAIYAKVPEFPQRRVQSRAFNCATRGLRIRFTGEFADIVDGRGRPKKSRIVEVAD